MIERAHWQRTFRPRHEALWDYVVGKLFHVPLAGVRLDRMMVIAIPFDVAEQLDEDLFPFVDAPDLEGDEPSPSSDSQVTGEVQATGGPCPFYVAQRSPRQAAGRRRRPARQGDGPTLPSRPFPVHPEHSPRAVGRGDRCAGQLAPARVLHRTIPVGPYELAVIPTGRGRSASVVRAVLQGMQQRGKQIEIFTPAALAKGDSASQTVIAIWIYHDASMVVVHLDSQYKERYVLWHAPDAHQFNYDYVEELRVSLSTLSLEVPDQLNPVLCES